MKTYMATAQTVEKDWFVVDAQGLALGRLASRIAMVLRGKHKPTYTPHEDAGDFVIVVNADKVKMTGNKWQEKRYYRHSGDPGHLHQKTAAEMRVQNPERVVRFAVWGMLPKNRLGRSLLKKLKVYGGAEHPHEAQQPHVFKVAR